MMENLISILAGVIIVAVAIRNWAILINFLKKLTKEN